MFRIIKGGDWKMKLIITRHGETEENVAGICQGHNPGKLTKKGEEQAKKLAERLSDEKIDFVFSSDLARASDTAKEIMKFHPEIPIYFVKELRERFQGKMQGKVKKDIKGWEIIGNRDKIAEEAGAEKIEEMVNRAGKFLEKLLEGLNNKNILLVGHRAINTAIISDIVHKNWKDCMIDYPLENTSVTIFEVDKNKKPELKLINCIKHLA